MPARDEGVETVLIVDDEESVRKTFREWLEGASLGCRILMAADAEAALVQANEYPIDLAILDWNLGAGNDGLQLLKDLYVFNADVVAIMVTGFAQQATPLDAMRMGVRDYLEKNQELSRDSFLAAVRKQLQEIQPARRQRRLHRTLVAFREAVEKILPLVQSAAALNDPVPLPDAIRSLLSFLRQAAFATDAVLLVHSYDPARRPAEIDRVYDQEGRAVPGALVPFARSLAATVVSLQEPYATSQLDESATATGFELQSFERGRRSLLAAPLNVGSGLQVVLELFDKQDQSGARGTFTAADQRLVAAASDFGAELLRQALAERQTHQVLFAAIEAALGASARVTDSLQTGPVPTPEEPPPQAVMNRLREGLRSSTGSPVEPEETVRLAEAIRGLAVRHGPAAIKHCTRLLESVRELLDGVTLAEESRL